MTELKISVVLPTYNVEPYINRCIQSLLHQTVNNFEILFVDDCGTDNSISIVKKYLESDKRIRIVSYKENLGTFKARKVGVEEAIGDYILFLDPDDELEKNAIEVLSGYLKDAPDLVLYGSRRVPSPKFWQLKTKVPVLFDSGCRQQVLNDTLGCKGLSYGTEGKLIKRELLLKVYKDFELIDFGGERLTYGEDKFLFALILNRINSAISCHKQLYIYYRNATSITLAPSGEDLSGKIKQLALMIELVCSIDTQDLASREAQRKIIKDIKFDKLIIEVKKSKNSRERVIKSYQVAKLSRSIRGYLKFFYIILLEVFKL